MNKTAFVLLIVIFAAFSVAAQPPVKKPAGDRQLVLEEVKQLPSKAKRWALVIGVDDYKDKQISQLRGAANDAKTLARALHQYAGFPEDQIILLATDQPEERQPTRVNILRRLSNLSALVPKDGLLFVSFAGHGMERNGQAYLLPSDAQISDDISFLEETAVSVPRMKERIKATGVGQILVLLDACRNDPSGRADAPNNLTQAYKFDFDVKNREVSAFATLYATAIGERAYEYSEKQQGYFTWAVVEAFKGAAANERGEVTLANLLKFVQESVPKRVTIDLGGGKNQKPFAIVEGYRAEDLILAVASPNAARNDAVPEIKTPQSAPAAVVETKKPAASKSPVDEILEKHIRAVGGEATIRNVKSIERSGVYELTIGAVKLEGTVCDVSKFPNKSYTLYRFNTGATAEDGFDGVTAWHRNPETGLQKLSGAELELKRRYANLIFAANVDEFKSQYAEINLKGKEIIIGREYAVLEAVPRSGKTDFYYFDTLTGLLVRYDTEFEDGANPGQFVPAQTYIEQYGKVGSMLLPFAIRQITSKYAVTTRINPASVRLNGQISDSTFAMPQR